MKILLINPFIAKEEIFEKGLKDVGALLPPLGLAYIAAVLEQDKHVVKIIDCSVLFAKEGYNKRNLEQDIRNFNPTIVGLTATSPQIESAKEIIDSAKRILPECLTFLGGPHVTALPQVLRDIKSLDYGIYGEGEILFRDMVRKIEKREKIENSPGLIWKDKKKIKIKKGNYIENLDELPMPARHLLPMQYYRPSPANYRRLPATTIITSRGCPFQCIFCHKPIFGYRLRAHSPKRVVDEIEYLMRQYEIKDIQIFDDTFTLNKKRTEEICAEILKRKLDIVWNCMTRMDAIDERLLRLMHKAGCYEVGYGIESGTERILKLINKNVTKETIRNACKSAKKAGIDVRGFFMIGFPTETREEILETIKFAKKLDVDVAQFMVVTPYPDTKLWELCEEHGKINVGDWSNFTFYSPAHEPFTSNTLNSGEINKLYRMAFKKYYLRISYIIKQLLKIRSFLDIHRNFLAAKAVLDM